MRVRLSATFFSLAFLLVSSLAQAATMRTFQVGNWFAGAYTNDANRQFSHCAANAPYRSGINVFFSINNSFRWSMGFAHPDWQLQPGSQFDVAFVVDDMSPLRAQAVAVTAKLVRVDLLDSTELFARFRRGYTLKVATANRVFDFSLKGTSQLLPALLTCAANKGAPVQMASNPFAPRTTVSTTSGARDDSVTKAEATAFAANLLSLAGVQGFTMLAPADHPEIKGQARWINGSTFGSVDIVSNITNQQLKNISGYLIGADATACKGTFFSGAIPEDQNSALARVFTTCEIKNQQPLTVYYLAVPRKAGGVYVISTLSLGSETPAKEADASIRSAVLKVSNTPSTSPSN